MYEVRFDPEIGYLLQPNLRVMVTNRESDETYELQTNSLGFRGPEYVCPKPPGVKRIAVLGDSFVEGRAYDDGRTFCGQLERLLNESSASDRWEVMNLGMGGQNTATQLTVYQRYVKPFDPDIVILCVTLTNDIRDSVRELSPVKGVFYEFEEDGRLNVIPPLWNAGLDLKNRSKFYLWQKAKVQAAIDRCRSWSAVSSVYDPYAKIRTGRFREAQGVTAVPLNDGYQRGWKVTEKILELFRAQVEQAGSCFYTVSLPSPWQVHGNLFDEMRLEQRDPNAFDIDQPCNQLAGIAHQLDIELLELTPSFRKELSVYQQKHPDHPGKDLLFLHGIGHFTEHAHQLVAAEVFQYLKSTGQFAPASRADQMAQNPANRFGNFNHPPRVTQD